MVRSPEFMARLEGYVRTLLSIPRLRRFQNALRRAYRDGGVTLAMTSAARILRGFARYRLAMFREYLLERRLGIDTRDEQKLSIEAASSAVHFDGVQYGATPVEAFSRLLRSLQIGSPSAFTFIDLGCGKGRLLVLAAMHGFGHVVGVELDGELLAQAQRNISSWQKRRGKGASVELVRADAARYRFPLAPIVVYMHNPFGEGTMRDVVANIRRSWEDRQRPVIVAYYNPLHQRVLDDEPILRRQPGGAGAWSVFAAGYDVRPIDR
jgi:SAM-dependent methyltransferase